MNIKYHQVREAAESNLEVFIRLVAPHLILGGIHSELISWWYRQEAKPKQFTLLPRGHLKSKLAAYRKSDGFSINHCMGYVK